MKLILASSSPQRKQLLENIRIFPDEIIPADVDESPTKAEIPNLYVKRIAIDKAEKVAAQIEDGIVIAADTIAAVGRRIIGKASTLEEAKRDLQLMAGRRHNVHSGLCIIKKQGGKIVQRSEKIVTTSVRFKKLTEKELDWYVAQEEWRGKSGSFTLMGLASGFIEYINGSHTNVIGLPLCEVKNILNGMGYNLYSAK